MTPSAGPVLSVLDQSIACAGRGEDHALRDTLDLAVQCEAWGYRRFWVSEHHGMPTIVGSAPEILLAALAARTTRMRLGSAGVMLPHYSAFKVAEQFRVLDALAPGRIDLGVGRAPGTDGRTARLLNPHATPGAEDSPQQVVDLAHWTQQLAHRGVVAHPRAPADTWSSYSRVPELWMLGSSDYGAQLAAHLGLPYAFAYFFTDGQGADDALQLYHQLYKPSERHPQPHAAVCIWALVADDADTARHHARSRERWRLDRDRGVLGPLQHPDHVTFSAEEDQRLQGMRRRAFVGTADEVAARIRALAVELKLAEVVVNTWAHEPAVRRRSYDLLAQAFGLHAGSAASAQA